MNLSFLFWNLNRKPLWDRLASIVLQHHVDIIMLAECPEEPAKVCRLLYEKTSRRFHAAPDSLGKVQLLTSFPEDSLTPVFDDSSGRLTIQRLRLDERRIDILVAVTHFPSKTNYSDDDQHFIATEIARDISVHEDRFNNHRTILVGDFNMNPFEKGIVGAVGLHAAMTRSIAEHGTRTISSKEYRYFYNPMWSCFGDRSDGPAGTYYYRKSTPISYFWNMFDQVLLRPEIMHWLKNLQILDHDGTASLLNDRGIPDSATGSDHLPLYFLLQP